MSVKNILPIRRLPKTFSLDQEDTLEDTITTTYYLCEEFLKATGHRDDPQVLLSTAEVMTIALVAAAFFGANIEASRSFLDEYAYIKKAISKSRFNRRLHAIDPCLWRMLFDVCWPKFSSTTMPLRATWWTPCRLPSATTFAFAAASFIPHKSMARLSAATL
jgi:hypothetical protein